MSTTAEKIFLLRTKMLHLGIDAFIIPGSDPHMSEYTAAHWKKESLYLVLQAQQAP